MKQEDKDLLLKDFCARLPYGVKVGTADNDGSLENVWDTLWYNTFTEDIKLTHSIEDADKIVDISEIKLYLFPLSSMTDEQKEDLLLTVVGKEGLKLFSVTKDGIISNDKVEQTFENFSINSINFSNKNIEAYIDWFNKNHFDYRGFIGKGLAIDCTNLNIY
jgi:hypothetical protein